MAPGPHDDAPTSMALRMNGALDRPQQGRLGFSEYDKLALTAFVSGDPESLAAVIEDTRQLAESLAADDGDAARVRLLARATAAARTQERILESLLGDRLAARDETGVAMVSKVLDGVTRRLALLLKQMSVESSLRRRPTVIIRHADSVSIRDE